MLTDQTINHITAITHDGKVVCFGTTPDGTIWYTVKRSGFEDTAMKEGADPFAFEDMKELRLGEATADASVTASEQSTLSDADGNVLVKSVYGDSAEATKSADAPVQVVSALNHLFVFRQSPSGQILVNRFVLDGMTNELVPKLEVRFRRSKQRLVPQESAASKDGGSFDNLDYRDIDGKYFYEGALELGFAGTVANGWFSPVFVPTAESDRNRWHLFVYDATAAKIVLYTVGSGDDGLFDVKDYLFGQQDPTNAKNTVYRSIPGILRRTIDLQKSTGAGSTQALTVAGGPSATTYDLQKEQMTDAGPQLVRDTVRVMLAVPVTATDSEVVKTAIIDFALARDGTLSQIDLTPDQSVILRSDTREVMTPLTLLDDIKQIADTSPPPSGTILATERSGDDRLQIRSQEVLPASLATGAKVHIRGTQSYDGHYRVLSVNGATFQVAATFTNNEPGFWELAPDKQTGLVFDNMVVGSEKTMDGRLMIVCTAHDLEVGDEVQISGTREYDGIFPIVSVVAGKNGFVLDTPFFAGEAANLSKVARRGLRMDGNDRVETPDLELVPPSPERDLGRTLSAWARVDVAGNLEQSLVEDSGGMMNLALGSDNKVKLVVRMSDGATRTVIDPNAMPVDTWVHYAGTVDYITATGGDTRIALCRDGVEVAQQSVGHALPCHLGQDLLVFDGVDDFVALPSTGQTFAQGITVEAWVYLDSPGQASAFRGIVAEQFTGGTDPVQFSVVVDGSGHQLKAGFYTGTTWQLATDSTNFPRNQWVHVAATYDGHYVKIYRDGMLVATSTDLNLALPAGISGLRIGRRHDLGNAGNMWNGRIADVRLFNRARTQAEIAETIVQRLTGREAGLVGYWPLDNGTTKDLSPAKQHGSLNGNAVWKKAAYLHPQIVPPAAPSAKLARTMKFDGVDDFIEVPAHATPTSAITVSVWARSATPTWNDTGCLVSKRDAFMFSHQENSQQIIFSVWINGAPVPASFTLTDIQAWHLYTGTYDGSQVRLYIDGTPVGEPTAATGAIAADASGVMCIGHDDGYGATERNFNGQLADVQVWSIARSQADIQADMYRRLTGKERDLVGYWPLDADASDLSPSKRNGSLKGNPALVSAGGAHTIGQTFSGEIASVQIWDEARAAADIKATMHLNLSGKENGLAAYYRMGAIVHEEQPPIVPDFSHHGRNAVVFGDPYAGARRLDRATGSGMKVVKYSSEDLVAVSQHGVYEESFEFKVIAPAGASAVDPSNADGTGRKLFAFSYWGKSSRGSKEVKAVPAGSVQQVDFSSPVDDWYKATCRVVVPDGITLLRAFEISDVRGRWGAESSPPATEWTAIDVRKHRIRLISDAVTRDNYTDVTALSSLPAQAQAALDNLTALGRAEAKVDCIEAQIRDLMERIDVVENNQRYVNEQTALTNTLASLQSQRTTAQTERTAIENNRWSYYQQVLNLNSGREMTAGDDHVVRQYGTWRDTDYQRWRFVDGGGGYFNILQQRSGLALAVPNAGGWDTDLRLQSLTTATSMQWKLVVQNANASYYALRPRHNENLYAEIAWESTNDGAAVQLWGWKNMNHQKWHVLKTGEMTREARSDLNAKNATIASLNPRINATQARIDWLTQVLATNESLPLLQSQLSAAQTDLTVSRTDLATKNTAVITGLAQASPATMPDVATDDRELVTAGAVLDFAQPMGRVRLAESCEGNLLLTYFDPQGRMRATPYDAAADSRNATFEQWLPDAVRAAADIRESGDTVTLAQAVSLPASGWTCEAWVRYPLATRSDGAVYDTNVVASAGAEPHAPIMAREGSRLGLMVDGWSFDSGVDLGETIAAGWHHLAVATSKGTTAFYADGVKLGSRTTSQPAIRFNGTADRVVVPAHASPTTAVTVSIWARSATPNWNGAGFLVSKRDAFIMHPAAGTKMIQFYVWISNLGWRRAEFTPADIQGWHLYTGTFDGNYILLYIDGEFVAELAVTGTIQASSGSMYIGYDTANNAYFNGDIAEVSIWSSARSSGEVREDLYRSFKGDEAGLVGYWRMEEIDEGGVLKVKDLTSNARHGLLNGAPADATITTMRTMDINVLGNASSGASPVGRLGEVRLWNLRLSDAEVAAHARASISGNEPGLVGYWPFDEAAGATAFDRSAGGTAHGSMVGVDWVGRTANIGNMGSKVLNLPDRGRAYVQCPAVALSGKSVTIECWARRSGANLGQFHVIAFMGTKTTNQGLHFGFRENNRFTLAFWNNDVDSDAAYTDTDWHHWCATYDKDARKQRVYCDGVNVGEHTEAAAFTGSGALTIGRRGDGDGYFMGDIAEVRIWDGVRTDAEIRANMRRRIAGTEANLLAYYPLNEVSGDNRVKDKKVGLYEGQLSADARLLLTTSLPAGAESLITAEYSSIGVSAEGRKQALMRRFFGFTTGGEVQLLPEQRVEELTLQWVGNPQITPTLLGYIEGAPPVPSENFTAEDADYNGATTVTLSQSEETSYHWQRSEAQSSAFNMDGFVGAAWSLEAGAFIQTKISEGQAGVVFNYAYEKTTSKETSVSASSSLTTTDSLALSGMFEDKISCPPVGKRWVPKNAGYALVISGMADVFVTKLKRSGRMVSYDIRPVDGVPLDVNTITFMINPAYTLNGSLDGMVGSMPADQTFYPHVPDMRSQYGSLYPASYFRLKQAYALKDAIERQDKERESFFFNFNADQLDEIDSFGVEDAPSLSGDDTQPSSESTEDDLDAMNDQNEQQKKEAKSEADKRQAEIEAKHGSLEGQVRARAAFADWQLRMASIQTKAGKRNIVNTYVWDGDGGLRTEEQSFASTIEHSISTEASHSGGAGASAEAAIVGFKFSLSLVGSGSKVDASSKTLSTSESLQLGVDLSGVEKRGIADLQDNPLAAGEKVDRYRFMTFYLEGSTDHFSDFFSYVVDPEWLLSNDEEARALRQARAAKPNKCWRVLHRVTYVERPALMGFGRDARALYTGSAVVDYFAELESKQQALDVRLGSIEEKLAAILDRLP